jgi:LysM repeat protein
MIRRLFQSFMILVAVAIILSFAPVAANAQTTYINYVVKHGDTLGKIAFEYCTTWKEIYDINRDAVGSNPNSITPGMVLIVPSNCSQPAAGGESTSGSRVYDRGPMTHATGVYRRPYYTVAWGDTLTSIGQRFGVDWQMIAKANNVFLGTLIFAGETLIIPESGSTTVQPGQPTPAERVSFQPGAISASRSGHISQGVPERYILGVGAGQTLTITTKSAGEPLFIALTNSKGEILALRGTNSKINNTVSAKLPAADNYVVTITPVILPESPVLSFDITFIIPK